MKNTKKIVTGLAFAATLALSLMASGGDAYARVKSGGGNVSTSGGGTITFSFPTPATEIFEVLGITWE
jgi:hypothetical protein